MLEEHKITIRMDHNALNGIISQAERSGRLVRWQFLLPRFEFDIIHRSHIKTQGADPLLYLKTGGTDTTKLEDDLQDMMMSLVKQRREKINDGQHRKSDLL